jgi:hypothetical protein
LRQAVGDGEPWCLGANEDVRGRADGGIIYQRPHRDMDPAAIADNGIEQRATLPAVRIVAVFITKDHAVIAAFCDGELVAFDAGERLEGGTGGAPTVRAVTVRGISELVRYRIVDGAAEAFSGKGTVARHLWTRHRFAPCAGYHAVAYFTRPWLNSNQTNVNQQGARPMSHDRSTVEAVVQHYFDALYEGDADKLGAIFHPSADLRSVEKGELQVLTVPDWLGRVRKRPSAKAEGKPREDFIVTIDRSDDSTAFIKVRCQLPPRYFTDYLVAMKLADGWQIVSKSYRYDLKE